MNDIVNAFRWVEEFGPEMLPMSERDLNEFASRSSARYGRELRQFLREVSEEMNRK